MRLLEQMRNAMRLGHYPIHTERSYVDWIKGADGGGTAGDCGHERDAAIGGQAGNVPLLRSLAEL